MIAVSMIVRNEADRHLIRSLECCKAMGAPVYVTDDASDDDTVEILEAYDCVIQRTGQPLWWTHEGKARMRHLVWMERFLTPGDWVLALDADETINDPDQIGFVVSAAKKLGDEAIALPLYEFWTETEYRTDGFWFGTNAPVLYAWKPNGAIRDVPMGCGREPTYVQNSKIFRQKDLHLLHWGYLRPEDRVRKHAAYSSRLNGHGHNNDHVNSIITTPTLATYNSSFTQEAASS